MKSDSQSDYTNIQLKNILFALNAILAEQKKTVKIAEYAMYLCQPANSQQSLPDKKSVRLSKPPPLFLRPADVAKILEMHPRSAERLLRQIRSHLGLPPKAFVSIEAFAEFKNIPVQEIIRVLNG